MSRGGKKIQRAIPVRERERVKASLIRAYAAGHTPSGKVVVSSLAFSRNPDKWRISATTKSGTSYDDYFPNSRTDVHLTAVLSYDWISPKAELTLTDEDRRQTDIIVGVRELDPPEGVTRLQLLTVSKNLEGNLRIYTEYRFRFITGDLTIILGERLMRYPSQLKLATGVAYKQYQQVVAKMVADRLNPKPKSITIKNFAERLAEALDPLRQSALVKHGMHRERARKIKVP